MCCCDCVGFDSVLSAGVWRCRRVHASGHPHHRVLPGLHLQHRLLPPTLGPQLGSRTLVAPVLTHTNTTYTFMLTWCIHSQTSSKHTRTTLFSSWLFIQTWWLSDGELFVSPQSCRRCCGSWWCASPWGGMAMWGLQSSLWFLPSSLCWRSASCWLWRDSQPSCTRSVCTGKDRREKKTKGRMCLTNINN